MRLWGLTPPQWRELPEVDRDLMLAESELVCPNCGNLRSVCSDPDIPWYPQRSECYASAAKDLTWRRLRKRYQQEPDVSRLHPLDGVNVWMSEHDFAPDETFFDLRESTHGDPGQNDGEAADSEG